jgi:DNA-binding IclR family transcriptional regulator
MVKVLAARNASPDEEAEDKDPQFAYTLARGLDVLRAFEGAEYELGNREIAARTGISRTTVVRLTRTLAMLGYLQYESSTARYRLAVSMLSLAYPLLCQLAVRRIARPLMQRLANYAHGAVSLGMRQGLKIVLVDSCVEPNAVTGRPDIGAARCIARTAIGRAYIAGIEESERKLLLSEIRSSGIVDWKNFKPDMDRELERFRTDGFCVACHAVVKGVYSAGVAFRGAPNGGLMVMNCVIADFQTDEQGLVKDIGPRLVGLAQQVQHEMGRS